MEPQDEISNVPASDNSLGGAGIGSAVADQQAGIQDSQSDLQSPVINGQNGQAQSQSTGDEQPGIDWQNVKIDKKIASLLSVESLKRYRFIPFEITDDSIKVAIVDRNDVSAKNALRFFASKNGGKRIEEFPIDEDDFEILMKKIQDPSFAIGEALGVFEKSTEVDEGDKKEKRGSIKLNVLKDAPVAKMVEVIIKNAIEGGASDIHIEPMDKDVRVRYRVDGVLYNSINLPVKVGPAIVSRVKILSNLKIDEKRKPQDGRFRIRDMGKVVDFRVSTFPISHGEKVVMRILDNNASLINLDKLGIKGRNRIVLERVIQEPHGIILVTGPTGSGKSTTLYSVLKILNKIGVNIVTLEDPVEYVLEGVNQSQVKAEIDYNFASGLRSILRQDPDIIMVGEIRDEETAELAIHAALTGHLVLSTIHTNSAIGAIARLVDMGIQPFLIASSVKLLVGQRLVRRICPKCKEEIVDIHDDAIDVIKKELKKMPPEVIKKSSFKPEEGIKIYQGKGCKACQNSGMKGRIGIFEVIEITNAIGKMVGNKSSESDIEEAAKKDGYTTMKQNGILKVLGGHTTIEEVQRVTEDFSEDEVIPAKGE